MNNSTQTENSSIDSFVEENIQITGTRFVIGGNRYEPVEGERFNRPAHTDITSAKRHFHTCAKDQYLAEEEPSASIWRVDLQKGRVKDYALAKSYDLTKELEKEHSLSLQPEYI